IHGSYPACLSIKDGDGISILCVRNYCALTRGPGVDLNWNLHVIRVVAFDGSFGNIAGERGQTLGIADRLDILVENMIGGGLGWTIGDNLNSVCVLGGDVVLLHEARDHFGDLGPSMAGVAG